MKTIFYPEIQALRAIAVISIFLYHLQLNFFKGGFVGVDIFFVISGFLITRILLEKKITLFNFYISRLKRITPTLLFTVIIVFVFITIIFLPEHINHFYSSVKYTLLFCSNIFFWLKSANYFDINSYFQPLLHTWSLSLEMQFYLIMPFFIFFLKKLSNKNFIFFSLLIIISSLILSILFIGREQSFYFLPFRLCEFFVGTLAYYFKKQNLRFKYNDQFFFFNLIILFYLILNINNLNFPGIKGVLISSFVGFLILLDVPKNLSLIIKSRIFQFVGLISYSLFLIHWPVIVIYKYLIISDFRFQDYFYISIITLSLSTLSYFLIEKNFQKLNNLQFKKIFIIYPSLFLIFIIISNLAAKDLNKFNFFMNDEKQKTFDKLKKYSQDRKKFLQKLDDRNNEELFYNSSVIFGDSHATDIFLGIKQNKNNQNYYYVSNNLDCFQILSEKKKIHFFETIQEYLFSKKPVSMYIYNSCLSQIIKLEKLLKTQKIEYVIISMKWNENELKYIKYILDIIQKYNTKIILISKRIEIPNIGMAVLKNENIQELNNYINQNIKRFNDINNQLKKLDNQKDIKFFDLNEYICDNHLQNCNFVDQNEFKYLDYSHFTLNFSKILMKKSLIKIK